MPPAMSSAVREPRMESRSASRFAGRRVHFIGIGGCGMSGLARMLLDAGADANIHNEDAESPLMIAQTKGHQNVVEVLDQHKGSGR